MRATRWVNGCIALRSDGDKDEVVSGADVFVSVL